MNKGFPWMNQLGKPYWETYALVVRRNLVKFMATNFPNLYESIS